MQIIRDPGVLSGFRFEAPVPGWPALTHCGEAVCGRGHFVPLHLHPAFEFTLIARAAIRIAVAGRISLVNAGDMFVAYPGESHAWARPCRAEFAQLWVGVDLRALGPAGRQAADSLLQRRPHVLTGCRDTEMIFRGVMRQVVSRPTGFERVVRAYMAAFAALLHQRLCRGDGVARKTPAPYSYPVQKAIGYMNQTPARLLRLSALAHIAGLAPSHFLRRFRAEVGLTPVTYYRQLRLQEAREALRQEETDITAIALAYGFSSSQHFATAFRKHFGTSPRAWREKDN